MRQVVIVNRPNFSVTSFGNGLSYTLERKPSGQSIFFQGEDAERFREELEALEARWETDEVLARLWRDYVDLAS